MLRILEGTLSGEKNVGAFDRDEYASRINAVKTHILSRNADISRRISPDTDDENGLIAEEIQTVLERWQRFAETQDQKLYYGERFLVAGPKNDEKRLLKVFSAHRLDGENPFETMTSMRSVDGTIQGNVRIWED